MKSKKIIFIILSFFFLNLYFFVHNIFSLEKNGLEQKYAQLFDNGEKYRLEGEFQRSIELFENSLVISKKIPDEKKECESLIKLGLLYWNIGNLKNSSIFYEQALGIAQKLNLEIFQEQCRSALEIYGLYEKGKKFRDSADYQKSIDSFQQAIDLARKLESKEHELKCLRQLSYTYNELNELQELNSLSQDALNIAQNLNHKIEIGRCYNHLGLYYLKINNYSKALFNYKQALEIAKEENNINEEEIVLTNIGIVYQEMGIYDNALDFFEKAYSIDKELGNNEDIVKDLNNIGETFRRKGLISGNKKDFNSAKYYFMQSLNLIKKIGDKKTETRVLNNIGSVHNELKQYNEAMKYFDLSYKKAEEIQDNESMAMILTNIGYVYFNLGNYEESTKYYEKAIHLALGKRQILWEAYMESGRAYEKQNQFYKALESFNNSIETIEKIRSSIDLEEEKAKYLGTDKRIDAYHYYIDLLISFPQPHLKEEYKLKAFNYLERAKARAFLDSLEVSKIDISHDVDPEMLAQEKEIGKNITYLYAKLLVANPSQEDRDFIQKYLKKYEDEYKELIRDMRIKSKAYANIHFPEIITVNEVQKELLNSSTALFEYCIGKEYSYAFVITKKDFKIFPLPIRDKIKKQVSEYLKAINNKDNQDFQLGYDLFNKLILPGLNKNIKTIIFIPDDILHFLPFETLTSDKEKNKWLIKDYRIAYAPSASSLREIIQLKKSNNKKRHKDILAFGDPNFGPLEIDVNRNEAIREFFSNESINLLRLKYSGYELKEISALFEDKKKSIFSRESASEDQLKYLSLKNELTDYKIVHFATHCIIDDEKPDRSSIVFSLNEDRIQSGFLQMRDIINDLKLNSDLVTLSACETGLGESIRGEGIDGFNRAFFYSGTSALLMSLWAVNDQASSQLMARFYRHLRSSESIMDALRNVKLEMINSDVLAHPYYWAGFIVSGKADEVIFPKFTIKWLILGILLLLTGGIIFAAVKSYRKRLKTFF